MATDLRQSEGWSRYLASQGWEVEEVISNKGEVTRIYVRRLPLLGSVVKIQRPAAIPPVKVIDEIARKHRALFVKLEPLSTINNRAGRDCGDREAGSYNELLTSHGFIRDSSPSLPTKTLVLDLTKSEKELWKALSQDTRHDIRKARSYQLSVISYRYGDKEFAEALKDFHQLLKETGRRKGFWAPSFNQLKAKTEAFGKNAILFLAYSTKQPIAGALILLTGETASYHYTATSIAGRKLNATYLLMWEIIKSCKRSINYQLSTINYLDLGSIYDPRYHKLTKSWQGFTLFKRKFGGKEVAYPKPLIKYYHPLAKLLFKLSTL